MDMASFLYLTVFLLLLPSPSAASPISLPVKKEPTSLRYTVVLHRGTPSAPVSLSLDLGGRYLWLSSHLSSSTTYRPVPCQSPLCASARSSSCYNRTCTVLADDPFSRSPAPPSQVFLDSLSLPPSALGRAFLFSRAPSSIPGVAGLGRTLQSLPSQISSSFSLSRKFALCLSPSSAGGFLLFGDSPLLDTSPLLYTPLLTNPISTAAAFVPGEPSYEYFVGVRGILVNGERLAINATLLSIDRNGVGGTKLSTVDPYAVVETSIFEAVAEAFERNLGEMRRIAAIPPFSRCFDAKSAGEATVPAVDLVLQSETVVWSLKPVVEIGEGSVLCLAIVDGGESPRTSIVIGGHQLEDNLVVFDLGRSRLGFSSSHLLRSRHAANCANLDAVATS